jgi:hypothetical protein
MRTILIWQDEQSGDGRHAPRVGEALAGSLSELFHAPLSTFVPRCSAADVVFVREQMQDWRLPFVEARDDSWAIATDYPIDGVPALESRGIRSEESGILTSLAALFEASPASVVAEIAPPFAVAWSSDGGRTLELQLDGLGLSQFFEYDDGRVWAVTNRLAALEALGVRLEPVVREWGVYAALGWFPGDMTGYRNVKRLGPGTRLTVHAGGRARTRHDALRTWLQPGEGSQADRFQRAAESVLRILRTASRHWSPPTIGLSGGWDSRVIVSSLTHLGVPFGLRVKGSPTSPDVTTAVDLARRLGVPIKVYPHPVPSERVADWLECADRAVAWQGGHLEPEAHKRFFDSTFRLSPARVNVMGKHGEVTRTWGYRQMGITRPEDAAAEQDWESRFVGYLLNRLPEFAPAGLVAFVREVLTECYREAAGYGLRGIAAVDFFYLNQVTRREKSAEAAAQNALVITPLLTPETIMAGAGMSAADRMGNALHRYVLEKIGPPGWGAVEFAANSNALKKARASGAPLQLSPWEEFFLKHRASSFYDDLAVWRTAGRAPLREAVATSPLIAELFEREIPVEMAIAMPDELFVISAVDRRFANAASR